MGRWGTRVSRSVGSGGSQELTEGRAKDDKLLVDINIDPLVEHGVEWALCHRADLQAELLRLATDENGPGKPCKVLFSHSVVSAVGVGRRLR